MAVGDDHPVVHRSRGHSGKGDEQRRTQKFIRKLMRTSPAATSMVITIDNIVANEAAGSTVEQVVATDSNADAVGSGIWRRPF
uniref:Uncharacterized protein n=1 Tax=Oryza nivara TaxID=4536 RepID=A0A0E0G549_ORYNI